MARKFEPTDKTRQAHELYPVLSMRFTLIVVLAVGLSLAVFHVDAKPAKPSTAPRTTASLPDAIARAERLGSTRAGRDYKGLFYSAIDEPMNDALAKCAKPGESSVAYAHFDLVFVVAADGHVVDLLCTASHPVAACVAAKLRGSLLPPPPKTNWFMHVNMAPP